MAILGADYRRSGWRLVVLLVTDNMENITMIEYNQADLDALDASIERWEQIVEVGGDGVDWEMEGIPDCELCRLQNARGTSYRNCSRCVIMQHTRRHSCRNTPYYYAAEGDAKAQQEMLDYLVELRSILINQSTQKDQAE